MSTRLRLATAQSAVTCDPAANGVAIRKLIGEAHRDGARLIHFPEGASSGYPGSAEAKQNLAGWDVDWAALRGELERTAELAGELGIWVVLGANHPLTPPHRPHNSVYVITDNGTLATRYDKRLLSHTEITSWYTPGDQPIVFDVDGFRFGIALCIEINFPELFTDYAALDVDCVLISSFADDPIFGILAQGHAAANNLWVSLSVPAQCSTAVGAGVAGPHGYWLGTCPANGMPAVVCVDLDRNDPALDVALHHAKPWRVHARDALIYAEHRVSDLRSSRRNAM